MKRRTILQILLIGILAMSITASAYAWVYSTEYLYYADSGFTSLVGGETNPGICCPEYEGDSWGNIETTYRMIYFYDECGWNNPASAECQSYYNGSWHLVSCP